MYIHFLSLLFTGGTASGRESLKKDPSINKVLREEKEDIEAQKYDASMILWYSKIWMKKKKRGQTDVTEKP